MITLQNEFLKVTISEIGAELQSVQIKNKEYLWQGKKEFWAGRAPLLFPVCGGLKDDKYIFGGREYILQKHGYARFSTFEAEQSSDISAVFLLKSDKTSKAAFPFDYLLQVMYKLTENRIDVTYNVKNTSADTMYFSIGAHEGYSCPEGIEEYSIVFEQPETLNSYILNGNLLERKTVPIIQNKTELPLKYEYFAVDALVFKEIKSKSVILKHNKRGNQIKVNFERFPYLLLWTKPGAPYICIEPWCGIQDSMDSDYDITKKEGIISLAPGITVTRVHTISIEGDTPDA